MADAYGGWAGSYGRWRCHINYGIESQNNSSAVVYCQTRFNTNAWGFDVNGTDEATVNGVTRSQSTVTHYSASGQTVDTTMITQRQTITKGTSAKTSAYLALSKSQVAIKTVPLLRAVLFLFLLFQ